jgi:low affinity Fe/Cu permease
MKLAEILSQKAIAFTASSTGFVCAVIIVVGWAIAGPILNYSQDWQFFINTFTSIATFLMVFLIQRAQSKDLIALNIKLNELIASQQGASNRLLNVEKSTEAELAEYQALHDQLPKDSLDSHSLEHAISPQIILPSQDKALDLK